MSLSLASIVIATSACPSSARGRFRFKLRHLPCIPSSAITQASDFKGTATSYTRDALGNAQTETTPDAGSTQTTHDALGLPQRSVDALGRVTRIERNALGRPTHVVHSTGAGGVQTRVLRDDLPGTLSSGVQRHQYDATGQLTTLRWNGPSP